MEILATFGILAVLLIIGIPLLIVAAIVVARRYRIASPSEALIVVTRKSKRKAEPPVENPETGEVTEDLANQKVILGGGVFVKPFFQKAYPLSLASRKIPIGIRGAVSKQGIRLNLDAVAIVKVGGEERYIRAAAQRFLNQQDEIETYTQEVLAGSLRAIVGTLTVDEIIRDRAAFASQVEEEAKGSLRNQGLVLDTFQIQDVTDDNNYLRDLGRPEAAAAARNAEVAEADAQREAAQAAARAQALVAESERDLALKKATFKADQDKASADADAAGALARAAREQEVLTEQEKVAQRQAALTERKLDTEVRKPADAARYQAEQEAQASRNAAVFAAEGAKAATVASAEADAARVRLAGEAELARRQALAAATKAEGEAEAAATLAKGEAEATAMQKRAEAFEQYGQAAVTQMVVDVLPQMAKEIAAPMSAIDNMTVISNDGAGKLAQTVGSNVNETLKVLEAATGLDITGMLKGFTGQAPTADSGAAPAASKVEIEATEK